MEQSTDYVPPRVMPSIGDTEGLRTDNGLREGNRLLSELTLTLCVVDQLLELVHKLGGPLDIALDSFRTDNSKPATITRVGSKYLPRRRA